MRITIEDVEYDIDPDKDVEIDPGNLDHEFITLPSLVNMYGRFVEVCKGELAMAKYDLERIYANEDCKARDNAKLSGVKLTERMVENTVKTSSDYAVYNKKVLTLQRNLGMIKATLHALASKESCLISLGANARHGNISPRIMEKADHIETKVARNTRKEVAKSVISRNRKRRISRTGN